MLHSATGRHPLDITITKSPGSAERIRMVYQSPLNDSDRFKSTMGMRGESGNRFTVVHSPSVFHAKILAQISTGKRCRRSHHLIAGRIRILVMYTKKKWITGLPGETQCFDFNNRSIFHRTYSD